MDSFITNVGSTLTTLATSFTTAVGSIAEAFVVKSEAGAITGLSVLGSLVAIGVGIGLLGAVIAFVRRFLPKGR